MIKYVENKNCNCTNIRYEFSYDRLFDEKLKIIEGGGELNGVVKYCGDCFDKLQQRYFDFLNTFAEKERDQKLKEIFEILKKESKEK